jgi:tetratricopeptide (TPR) repeat protein
VNSAPASETCLRAVPTPARLLPVDHRHSKLVAVGGMLAIVLLVIGCARQVTRISNGSARQDRSIAAQAYAAYARGRLQERQGDTVAAAASYREVLRLDRAADEAWVRIGALSCERDRAAASRAFFEAEQLNAESATLFRAKAQCSLLHRDFAAARSAAATALQLAPNDPEVSRQVIAVLLASGNLELAMRYAWSHVAVFPNDTNGWVVLAAIVAAPKGLHAQIQRRAAERVSSRYPHATFSLPSPQRGQFSLDRSAKSRLDLEHALRDGDARAVHRAARELGLGTLELISRAFELGALDFAHGQVTLAGMVQPDDARIWLERLTLADLLQSEDEFNQLLASAPTLPRGPNSIEWGPLFELIRRRTSTESTPDSNPQQNPAGAGNGPDLCPPDEPNR